MSGPKNRSMNQNGGIEEKGKKNDKVQENPKCFIPVLANSTPPGKDRERKGGGNPKSKLAFENFAMGLGEEKEGFGRAHSHLQCSQCGGERLRLQSSSFLGFGRRSRGLDLTIWVVLLAVARREERKKCGELKEAE